jgi:hypothetical protein
MNSRRALLHLVERLSEPAELVVGLHRQRVDVAAGGDAARRALEPGDAAGAATGDEPAADERDQQRDRARHEQAVPHEVHRLAGVAEVAAEHRDPPRRARVVERNGDLTAVMLHRPGAARRALLLERARRELPVRRDRRGLVRVADHVEALLARARGLLDAEQRHARARAIGQRANGVVDLLRGHRLAHQRAQLRHVALRRRLEVAELLVLDLRLELRQEDEHDDRQRERGDREEEERQPVPQRAASLHRSRKW